MILKLNIKPYLSSASWKAYRRLAVHCLQAACGFGHHHHTDHTFDYAFYRNKVDLARKKSTKIEIADLKNINDRISQWAVAILSTFCVISCSITAILTSNSQFSFVSFFGLQNEKKYFGTVLYFQKKNKHCNLVTLSWAIARFACCIGLPSEIAWPRSSISFFSCSSSRLISVRRLVFSAMPEVWLVYVS